ncbi:hypothetical protein HRI_003258300 [Hibiscus trionum]|uniref:C2 domain-containing protein n=1 Tax=Hibiscus trionum TaxID=183268 RepID=A0A9W7IJC7_HIBTR|nr:hypothetical protein HRI_003258300 [Hibiscus trionum]
MSDLKTSFQLLELNVISAQDLEPICHRRKMRTYAVAWVNSGRKFSTRIDHRGHTNPKWNDKFTFRVDDEFLHRDTSAIMIEIYATHWLRDIHVGTIRAMIGNLIPHLTSRSNRRDEVQLGTTFVALQVWRPSGRPQGILNIGLALIDSSKRSMPLYLQMGSSAIGYKHLMGEEENRSPLPETLGKPKLRRTKSDSSSIFPPDLQPKIPTNGSSIINGGGGSVVNGGGGSIVNGFEPVNSNCKAYSRGNSMVNCTLAKINPRKGKSSSVVNGDEAEKSNCKVNSRGNSMVNCTLAKINSRGNSMVNYTVGKLNPRKGKSSSVVNGSEDPGRKSKRGKSRSSSVVNGLRTPTRVWTDSEIGPSPSEVAAAAAQNMHRNRFDDCESSILGWSLDDESLEGLRSKLERWRTEESPTYDWSSDASSSLSGTTASGRSRHSRSHSDDGGTIKCFGNICGCQISITCGGGGGDGEETTGKKKGKLRRPAPSYIYDGDT